MQSPRRSCCCSPPMRRIGPTSCGPRRSATRAAPGDVAWPSFDEEGPRRPTRVEPLVIGGGAWPHHDSCRASEDEIVAAALRLSPIASRAHRAQDDRRPDRRQRGGELEDCLLAETQDIGTPGSETQSLWSHPCPLSLRQR